MEDAVLGKILAIGCAMLWAFAVLFFKRSGETIPPVALNLYKSVIAALLFVPVMIFAGTDIFPASARTGDYLMLILSGIIGITVADSLFFKSLNILGAGLSAIVDCLYSPMLILLSFVMLGDTITSMEIIGGFLVVVAVLAATFKTPKTALDPKQMLLGIILGALAMMTLALSVIIMKPSLEHGLDVIWITEIRLVAGAVAIMFTTLFKRDRRSVYRPLIQASAWKFAFPGTVIGNFFAMTLWIWAFKLTEIASAAVLNQTSTIFIVILASVFLKEKFTIRRFMATCLAFGGSALVILN